MNQQKEKKNKNNEINMKQSLNHQYIPIQCVQMWCEMYSSDWIICVEKGSPSDIDKSLLFFNVDNNETLKDEKKCDINMTPFVIDKRIINYYDYIPQNIDLQWQIYKFKRCTKSYVVFNTYDIDKKVAEPLYNNNNNNNNAFKNFYVHRLTDFYNLFKNKEIEPRYIAMDTKEMNPYSYIDIGNMSTIPGLFLYDSLNLFFCNFHQKKHIK